MSIINSITNLFNATVGRNQDFEQLIAAKDITRVMSLMDSHQLEAEEAMKEYDPKTHLIMERKDKVLKDLAGRRKGTLTRWKLPVGYPVYINEISLVFLFGQPVKWKQKSEGTDEGFQAYTDLLKRMHFNSKIRQCKRLAGSETESAMLFRVYRNSRNEPDCQIRVLARSKGDEIYTRWDVYENLITFAWGHYSKDAAGKTAYHLDIFTDTTIYHCQRGTFGWEVEEEDNPIGKIPVIYFRQRKEWDGVEELINREEYVASRRADTNDYFSDPYLVLKAALLKSMPDKEVENKTLVASDNVEDVSKMASFLTWDGQNESKKDELEWLRHHILTKTFTPDIDWSQFKGMSQMSGKALKQMMLLADIKATKHKENYDEMLDRTASLVVSIMANVLYISKSEYKLDQLECDHEYQEPFGEDIAETIKNINEAIDGGTMSEESGIEQNPLVKDKVQEKERIRKQKEEAAQQQRDIFSATQSQEDVFGGAE